MAVLLDTLMNDQRMQSAIGGLRSAFGFGAPASAGTTTASPGNAVPSLDAESQAFFDVKKNIIDQVRADAAANGSTPSLEQYRQACVAYGETDAGKAMGNNWNPQSYGDLSGQNLSGFVITEPKRITEENYDKKEETHGHHLVRPDYDGHDRDGDGQINVKPFHEFYDKINFRDADLSNTFVEPATSFNEEIAKAKKLEGITFNGMGERDAYGEPEKFTFGAGNYKGVHMTNINGGEIEFATGSHVEGVTIEGKTASITIGDYATVDNVQVADNFRIISLKMGKDSVLSNSNLRDSTISMTSEFAPGATFQNVELNGNNLADLNLSGLKLNNVTIDGVPITKPEDLDRFGIKHEGTTVTASAQLNERARAANLGESTPAAPEAAPVTSNDPIAYLGSLLDNARKSIGSPVETTPQNRTAELAASIGNPLSSISFAGEADTNSISMGTRVASLERTVPVADQAQGANMSRGDSGNA